MYKLGKSQNVCCFCGQVFTNAAEKNEHILASHFERKHCFTCNNQLISIGDQWYQLHNDAVCSIVKQEPEYHDYDTPSEAPHQQMDNPELNARFKDAMEMISSSDPLDESHTFDESNVFDDIDFDNNSISSGPELVPLENQNFPQNDTMIWSCRICFKTFTYRHNLLRHYRNIEHIDPDDADMGHGESNRWSCKQCMQTFSLKSNLNRHLRNIHNIEHSMVDDSSEHAQPELQTKTEIISVESVTNEVDFSDGGKLESISSNEQLVRQLQQSQNDLWTCKTCLRTFTLRSNLLRHMRNIKCVPPIIKPSTSPTSTACEDNDDKMLWYCDICPQSFTFQQNLNRHRKHMHQIFENNRSADSQQIGKSAKSAANKNNFVKERSTMRGENSAHSNSVELTTLSHSSQADDLSCRTCLKTFTLRNNLIRHIRNVKCLPPPIESKQADVEEIEKMSWPCSYCPQTFTKKANVRRHENNYHDIDDTLIDCTASEDDVSVTETPKTKSGAGTATDSKPSWTCDICSKTFTLANNLHRHKKDIHKIGRVDRNKCRTKLTSPSEWSCDICLKSFTLKTNLARHKRFISCSPPEAEDTDGSTSSDQQWICDYCGSVFSNRNDILSHMQRIHTEKCMIDCNICSLPFLNTNRLRAHLRRKHRLNVPSMLVDIEVSCNYCSVRFNKKYLLDAHKRAEHMDQITKDNIYKCSKCPGLFSSNAIRKIHLMKRHKLQKRIYKKLFKCYICAETFKFPASVVAHMEQHDIDGEYKCCYDACDVRIDSPKRLYYHLQAHLRSSETKKRCEHCKRCYSEWTFDNHRCIKAPDLICHYCGKKCGSKYILDLHLNTHTGNKPYKCDFCDMAFSSSYTKSRHQHTHTGEKPCKCTVENCNRAFVQHIDLYRHLYKTHGIFKKKYPCNLCDLVFPENALLRKHLQSHGHS